ncbi:MAG: GTPase [Candidatus Methanomethylophilaceae archaeon]|nr:GTPase [Candidatus Methanomethylophilaceae archaeon]MBP5734579.1 GTPase [Candidatus Methanomethylophilaceae archaeon]
MKIHIIGGFLGSGKTTLIMAMAERYIEKGLKVTILENEAGEIGVDGAVLRNKGLDAVELTNGCICCTLTGTLQSTMRSIERDIDPDILIIEPTGLALPHKVTEMIRGTVDDEKVSIIGVCDAVRFPLLVEKKEEFIRMQLSKSDVLWINKIDSVSGDEIGKVKEWLSSICPKVPVYPLSGKTGEGLEEAFSNSLYL